MARETNAQLKEKCDQLQKSLDDAKLTIRQLEINIKIMGENAEKRYAVISDRHPTFFRIQLIVSLFM